MSIRNVKFAPILLIFCAISLNNNKTVAKLGDQKSRIVKGITVAPVIKKKYETLMENTGEFPYIASFHVRRKEAFLHECGAIIIQTGIVLTAAHCTVNHEPKNLKVMAGTYDLGDILSSSVQVRNVENYLNHPKYRLMAKYDYDISLVWLKSKFTFGKFINNIKLATSAEYIGEKVIALGWGNDHEGKKSELLLRADLIVLPPKQCERNIAKKTDVKLTASMLCAQHEFNEQAICIGDSGGPLVFRSEVAPYEDVVIGLNSWGIVDRVVGTKENKTSLRCQPNYPSVFIDINYLESWINEHLNQT